MKVTGGPKCYAGLYKSNFNQNRKTEWTRASDFTPLWPILYHRDSYYWHSSASYVNCSKKDYTEREALFYRLSSISMATVLGAVYEINVYMLQAIIIIVYSDLIISR